MSFLVRRFLHSFVSLLCASLLSFALVELAPGDFFDSMRLNPKVSPITIERLRERHGSKDSIPHRYLIWLASIAKGDFGVSLTYQQPAAPILIPRVRNTLLLTVTGTMLAWLLAVPWGILSALKPRSLLDGMLSFLISFLLATPELIVALTFLFLATRSGYFPMGGMLSMSGLETQNPWQVFGDICKHLFLPAVCLAMGSFSSIAAHARNSMSVVLRSPFIAAANSLGIPSHRVVMRHALPVSANQLISLFGLSFGALISSSLLIEAVFGWPGVGQLLLEAVFDRDLFLVVDVVLVSSVFIIVGNLIADVVLYLSDPRIRVS
jgi:peptide/nickel transport system permease protein